MKISLFKFIFALVFFLSPFVVSAATADNMSGYAWSSNIGWISMNCTNNDGSCVTSNYGVNKDTSGNLVGYAWSPNIGWIQFGCPPLAPKCFSTADFPTGNGTQAQNANINGNNLKGWAKALSADGNGWDGWISLSGASPSYGVTLSGTSFSGYAWGADVVGWVDWSWVILGPAVPITYTVTPSVIGSGTISPSIVQTVSSGDTPTFIIDATGDSLSYSVGGTCPPPPSPSPSSSPSPSPSSSPSGSNITGGASPTPYTTGPITSNCNLVVTFSTNPNNNNSLPTVADQKVIPGSVTDTSVTLGATVTGLGNPPASCSVTKDCSGIVYSTLQTPAPTVGGAGSHTIPLSSNISLNPYTVSVTGLSPGTTYYFAGYATNSVGTGYSGEGTFTTSGTPPPGSTCQDPAANNIGSPLPCTYTPGSTCQDPAANNIGSPLPCTYTNGVGVCSFPAKHYTCNPLTNVSTNHQNFPSKVTWVCPGSGTPPGKSTTCSESKGPNFINN